MSMPDRIRRRIADVVIVVLALISIVLLVLLSLKDDPAASEPRSGANASGQVTPTNKTAQPSKKPSQLPNASTPAGSDIRLATSTLFGKPFETVRVDGTHASVSVSTELRVQLQRRDQWVSFPLPVVPHRSGRFTAHVELGRTGQHRLRVLDARTGAKSGVAVLYVR
jgi:hypothetical protein